MPRWALWAVGGFGLVGLAILSDWLFPAAPGAPADKPGQAKPLSLSPSKTEHEAWLAQAQGEVRALAQQVQQLSQKHEALAQALKDGKDQRLGIRPGGGPPLLPNGAGSRPVLKTATDGEGLPADPPPPMRDVEPPPSAAPSPPKPPSAPPAAAPLPAAPGPPVAGPLVAPAPAKAAPAGGGTKLRVIEADARAIPAKYWLPMGAILPVRLLSGVDAPAGGAGVASGMAAQPHPVLMQVMDLAKLPNETTMDATGCFALGESLGDISTERAMIRVVGVSCVKGDGVAVDMPVKGVVTGEDGKVGLRGRMVIRESAMLARTLLTGFVSGVARAFMPFQMGLFVAPSLGQALEPPPMSNVALAGMAGGMNQAAQMLAQHYAQMAARIYPVIEVDAGRWADLIVTEGRELKEPLR
jgi:conjugal transfer pilus assembly protein TraB